MDILGKRAEIVFFILMMSTLFPVYAATDTAANLARDDLYTFDGSDDDAIGWVNDGIFVRMEDETYARDVVCYNVDASGNPEDCAACTQSDLTIVNNINNRIYLA